MNKKLGSIKFWLTGSLVTLFGFLGSLTVEATELSTTQNLPETGEEIAITAIIGGLILIALVLIVMYLRRKKKK